MKITHTDGLTVDTDDLSESEALILQKSEELRKLCYDANRPCFIASLSHHDGKKHSGGYFWSFKTSEELDENGIVLCEPGAGRIIMAIDEWLYRCTNNNVRIVHNNTFKN